MHRQGGNDYRDLQLHCAREEQRREKANEIWKLIEARFDELALCEKEKGYAITLTYVQGQLVVAGNNFQTKMYSILKKDILSVTGALMHYAEKKGLKNFSKIDEVLCWEICYLVSPDQNQKNS